MINTRFYDIVIAATDVAGNTGTATCSVIVIPSAKCSKSQKGSPSTKSSKTGCNRGVDVPLVNEYENYIQRFKIGTVTHYYDRSLDMIHPSAMLPPPPVQPTSKSRKRGRRHVTEVFNGEQYDVSAHVMVDFVTVHDSLSG